MPSTVERKAASRADLRDLSLKVTTARLMAERLDLADLAYILDGAMAEIGRQLEAEQRPREDQLSRDMYGEERTDRRPLDGKTSPGAHMVYR